MKRSAFSLLAAFFFGFLVPAGVLYMAVNWMPKQQIPCETTQYTSFPTSEEASQIMIPLLEKDGTVRQVCLEDYVLCVVLREMNGDFEDEALKAQAVVARTYALRKIRKSSKHPDHAVCTQSSCCQGYRTAAEFLADGGSSADLDRIRSAVESTEGKVLMYDGALIDATYFSCSGGRTEDAADVWGADIPYLQATDSPGEESASHFTDSVVFSPEEFCEALDIKLSGTPAGWFGKTTHTAGGGVATMEIGGTVYEGTTLRKLLGLRSTAFQLTATHNSIVITTRGYGHRVGMSQYGADAMAVSGSSYEQILAHYYLGTELCDYPG